MFGFKVVVTGDFACFTRPELKVERVSYEVPTPGALEGLLKSIYWKPAIRYVIDKIVVFNPINLIKVRRNEVKDKILFSSVKKKMYNPTKDISIYTNKSRSQRSSSILKNVVYGIEFHFEMTGICCDREDNTPEKHFNIIKRRLENGQYFRSPCLGCCEYPVKNIELVENFNYQLISEEIASSGDVDLGFMLYRLKFEDGGVPVVGTWEGNRTFSDKADAIYYHPHMVNGIVDVRKYAEDIEC